MAHWQLHIKDEAPCLNRNVMAATTAISCDNMALADYNHLIPMDEVIETMKRAGDAILYAIHFADRIERVGYYKNS